MKSEIKTKCITCPMCNKPNAIRVVESNPRNFVCDDYSLPSVSILSTSIQYSHADTCPKLTHATFKKELLEFHTVGFRKMRVMKTDTLGFKEYKNIFIENGFDLISENQLMKMDPNSDLEEFVVSMYIVRPAVDSSEKIFVTYGESFQEAFLAIKHRLLCGEMIEGYTEFIGGRGWQMVSRDGKLDLVNI